MTRSHSPTYPATPPRTSHPFPSATVRHTLLHAPIRCHTQAQLGAGTQRSRSDSRTLALSDPYRRTLSHTATPWTVNLRRRPRSHGHTVTGGHSGTATALSLPLPHLGHPLPRVWVPLRRRRALSGPFTNWPSLLGGTSDSELAMANRGLSPPGNGEREFLQAGAAGRATAHPFPRLQPPPRARPLLPCAGLDGSSRSWNPAQDASKARSPRRAQPGALRCTCAVRVSSFAREGTFKLS